MKNTIRCCISCILPCGALDVIRIVHSSGRVEEISGTVKAREIMKAYPKHVLKKPSSASDDRMVPKIIIVPPEAELQRGKIYFLIPLPSTLEKNQSKSTKKKKEIISITAAAATFGVDSTVAAEAGAFSSNFNLIHFYPPNHPLGFKQQAAYCLMIGRCSVHQAELWAVFDGLELAWNLGFRSLKVETDNLEVARCLNSSPLMHESSITRRIRSLFSRQWKCEIKYTPREANKRADRMASMRRDGSMETRFFSNRPLLCKEFLRLTKLS
ncbi:hypothetical protein F3Y22_tig00110937pilonHSYRG00048 [Hibiscus syriacus]|uniref:RNase H type-1 domain-containing protein n=1 Tax=Hibiscus syriacus TaxID=106335 RepID=A0A6A2ZCX4_HIBSY|nr:hypothetical protein F3Y22_tig00110937pilonHSYRG00048 [Hibiscus syriacus]